MLITINIPLTITVPDNIKDLSPEKLKETCHDIITRHEDGRKHLAIETLEALTSGLGSWAMERTLSDCFFERYRNRMHKVGKGSYTSVACILAAKRLENVYTFTRVDLDNVSVIYTLQEE